MADYIDRQAAIAAIDEYMEDITGLYDSCWNGPVIVAEIKDIISELPSPWVSVEDRLPECDVRVLTYSKFRHMSDRKLYMFDDGTIAFRPDGMKPGIDITHWMPQPDAPEV